MTATKQGLLPLKGNMLGMREPCTKSKKVVAFTVVAVVSIATKPSQAMAAMQEMFSSDQETSTDWCNFPQSISISMNAIFVPTASFINPN